MAEAKEARVPDIGDYRDVPVIEVMVAAGDTVAKDQGLVTLESDKATLEVPAPFAGVVKEVKVKVGDMLSEGSVVALIEAAGDDASAPSAAKPAKQAAPGAPKAEADSGAEADRPGRDGTVRTSETGEKVEPVIDTGVGLVTRENMNEPRSMELLSPPISRYLK